LADDYITMALTLLSQLPIDMVYAIASTDMRLFIQMKQACKIWHEHLAKYEEEVSAMYIVLRYKTEFFLPEKFDYIDGTQLYDKNIYTLLGKRHSINNNTPAFITVTNEGSKDYLFCQYWYKHGKLHRDCDLPAKVYVDGDKEWYRDGKMYRDGDLPVVVFANGCCVWYNNSTFTGQPIS
jgi:hypothetical protein